jgi:muramoyltetrapeptide carboxypeptidase
MCKALATLPDDSDALVQLKNALKSGKIEVSPEIEGRKVIGGNLSLLYALQGTPYSLNAIIDGCEKPPMLLLEDIGERHYHIDRMLQNLRMSGVLSRVAGVIVGQFTDCEDDALMGCTVYETIAKVLAEYNYPIVWNAPYGHIDENIPIFLS